jgi:hypothetical protein
MRYTAVWLFLFPFFFPPPPVSFFFLPLFSSFSVCLAAHLSFWCCVCVCVCVLALTRDSALLCYWSESGGKSKERRGDIYVERVREKESSSDLSWNWRCIQRPTRSSSLFNLLQFRSQIFSLFKEK